MSANILLRRIGRARRPLGIGLLLALLLGASPPVTAQPPEPLQMPYLLQSIRSVDRLREVFAYLFGTVLRPDVKDAVLQEFLSVTGNATNLEGIDPSQPVGVVLVINQTQIVAHSMSVEVAQVLEAVEQADAPAEATKADGEELQAVEIAVNADGTVEAQPVVQTVEVEPSFDLDALFTDAHCVSFATITDWQAAKRLLGSGMTATTHLAEAPGRTDLYLGRDSSDGLIAMAVRIAGATAYVGQGDCPDVLDRLAAMRDSPSQVAQRHDATISWRLNELSLRARRTLSEALWKAAGAGLQQLDDEAHSDYALREATSRSLIDLIDLLFTSVEDVTASLDVDEPQQLSRVRLEVNAVPGSPLAERLANLGGPPSQFQPLVREGAALTVCLSVELTEFEQKLVGRWLNWIRADTETIESQDGSREAKLELVAALQQTVAAGHLDFFCEFDVASPTEFGVIGGLRLHQVDRFRHASRSLMRIAMEDESDADFVAETLAHRDFTLHHVCEPHGFSTEGGEWLPLDISFSLDRGALWFAGGAHDSTAKLKEMLDRIEAADASGETARSGAPLLVRASAARWLNLPQSEDFDSRIMRGLAERAFASHDRAQVELRASRRGLRLEGVFEEGFIRWLALLMTHSHDSSNL